MAHQYLIHQTKYKAALNLPPNKLAVDVGL